ncbi:MAG: phosphoglycerate mutase family protein [Streptosporangiales bacterium]|nr:phosphoglycerate mutase family protein [Streptosporangiales bacterium]
MGTLLLIRHGQASFGAANYDQLSEHGRHQAAALGADLARRGIKPLRLITGSLRRQRDTLEVAARAAGWTTEPEIDPRWNEFSHWPDGGQPAPRNSGEAEKDYERRADDAIDRWFAGETESDEPFSAFAARVASALAETRPGSGETYAVFTSSGVIAAAAAHLLAGGLVEDTLGGKSAANIWPRLNRVVVNSSVTKVVVGRRGMSLVSFNDHGHLNPAEVSYR